MAWVQDEVGVVHEGGWWAWHGYRMRWVCGMGTG